jgi:hypothetical protein
MDFKNISITQINEEISEKQHEKEPSGILREINHIVNSKAYGMRDHLPDQK